MDSFIVPFSLLRQRGDKVNFVAKTSHSETILSGKVSE
jgi:hypothetical protein